MLKAITAFLKHIHKLDYEITEKYLCTTPLHSTFWGKVGIRAAIRKASSYSRGGYLLDAGCGLNPYAKYFKSRVECYVGLDYSSDSGYLGNKARVYGDIKGLPFADGSFDTILCSEVLEHIDGPGLAISEFRRVLKAGGTLILTTPFIYPIHGGGEDFFRFTPSGLTSLFGKNGFSVLEARRICGPARTIAMLFNICFYDECFMQNKFFYPLGVIIRPALLCVILSVNVAAGIIDLFLRHESSLFFDTMIAARKN